MPLRELLTGAILLGAMVVSYFAISADRDPVADAPANESQSQSATPQSLSPIDNTLPLPPGTSPGESPAPKPHKSPCGSY